MYRLRGCFHRLCAVPAWAGGGSVYGRFHVGPGFCCNGSHPGNCGLGTEVAVPRRRDLIPALAPRGTFQGVIFFRSSPAGRCRSVRAGSRVSWSPDRLIAASRPFQPARFCRLSCLHSELTLIPPGQTHLKIDRTIEGTLKQRVQVRSCLYDNFAVFAGEFGAVWGVLGGS